MYENNHRAIYDLVKRHKQHEASKSRTRKKKYRRMRSQQEASNENVKLGQYQYQEVSSKKVHANKAEWSAVYRGT